MSGGGRNATMPGRLRPISLSGISIMYSGCGRSGPGLRIILSKIFANLSCLTGLKREPLEFWQEAYVRRYGRLCDSLCAVNPDVVFDASALNDHLRAEQNWYASSDLSFVEYGALQLLDERFGGCRELSGVQCGPVPGIGDPLRNRPVVQNPHRIGSHMWTFMVDTDGRKLPYLWITIISTGRNAWKKSMERCTGIISAYKPLIGLCLIPTKIFRGY